MATPPTWVASVAPSSNWGTGTSKTSTAFASLAVGDIVSVKCSAEHAGSPTTVTPTASGGSITWTARATQNTGSNTQPAAYLWTGVVGAAATNVTITLARPSSNNLNWGFTASQYTAHGGVGVVFQGNNGTGSGAPSIAATCSANSAVECQINDWNAVDGTTRTWLTINGAPETESVYFRNSAAYTIYGGRRTDVGAGGSVTQGLSVPNTMRWALVGIEILGTASGSSLTASPADSLPLTDSPATAADRPRSQADPLGLTDAATPAADRLRSQDDALGLTDGLTAGFDRAGAPGDPLGLTDGVTAGFDRATSPGDPLGLTDGVTVAWDRATTVGDALGLTDTPTGSQSSGGNASVADALGLTDGLTVAWDRSASIGDGLGLTDPTQPLDRATTAADQLGLTDTATATRTGAGTASLADPAGLTDALTVTWQRVTTVDDLLALADAASGSQAADRAAAPGDALPLTDSPSWSATRDRAAGDQLGLSDSVVAVLERSVSIDDGLGLVDAAAAAKAGPNDGTPVPAPALTVDLPAAELALTIRAGELRLTIPDSRLELT